jgi:hypothetical protein
MRIKLRVIKIAPNKPFLPKIMRYLDYGKSSSKIWATSVNFEKRDKANNYPMGEVRSQRPLHVQGVAGHPGEQGGGPKKK